MLALLLGGEKGDRGEALRFWQVFRQGRVDGVLELNGRVDRRRVPPGEGAGVKVVEREEWDLDWLYGVDVEAVVAEWVASRE